MFVAFKKKRFYKNEPSCSYGMPVRADTSFLCFRPCVRVSARACFWFARVLSWHACACVYVWYFWRFFGVAKRTQLQLDGVDLKTNSITVSGVDLVDGTPVSMVLYLITDGQQ